MKTRRFVLATNFLVKRQLVSCDFTNFSSVKFGLEEVRENTLRILSSKRKLWFREFFNGKVCIQLIFLLSLCRLKISIKNQKKAIFFFQDALFKSSLKIRPCSPTDPSKVRSRSSLKMLVATRILEEPWLKWKKPKMGSWTLKHSKFCMIKLLGRWEVFTKIYFKEAYIGKRIKRAYHLVRLKCLYFIQFFKIRETK